MEIEVQALKQRAQIPGVERFEWVLGVFEAAWAAVGEAVGMCGGM